MKSPSGERIINVFFFFHNFPTNVSDGHNLDTGNSDLEEAPWNLNFIN